MKIEKIKIEDIKPYENNTKLHPTEQVEQIKNSISEFGNNDPIAIDENNVIIEGHGRYLALKELGYKEVEVIRLNHLTQEQKRAYSIIHNKLTMDTGFDFNILDAELTYINEINMSDFGFEDEEINEEDFETDFTLNINENVDIKQLTISLHKEQFNYIKSCMEKVEREAEKFDGANKIGNSLCEIVRQYLESGWEVNLWKYRKLGLKI